MSCGRLVPAVPSCILEPLREAFLALLPPHVDDHPLRCHRPRIDDRVVFDKLVEVLVFGAGYERVAGPGCSATTLRRRRDEWTRLGVWDRLRLACLDAYDQLIGLNLADLAVDGCITKAPCGGQCAGRSPVDRAKGGLKRPEDAKLHLGIGRHAQAVVEIQQGLGNGHPRRADGGSHLDRPLHLQDHGLGRSPRDTAFDLPDGRDQVRTQARLVREPDGDLRLGVVQDLPHRDVSPLPVRLRGLEDVYQEVAGLPRLVRCFRHFACR